MSEPRETTRADRIFARLLALGHGSVRGFRLMLAVYIFMLVLLPSGSILGFNVKVLWFLALLPWALLIYIARERATAGSALLLLIVPAAMLFWLLLAQGNGFEPSSSFGEFKDILVTICTCWFAALLCTESYDETIFFLRTVVRAEIAACVLKGSLLTYAILRGIPVTEIALWIKAVFGVDLMTYDFESMLGRIQFHSDGLIPICIFVILCYRKRLSIGVSGAVGMLLLLLISDFFAFSRYLWVFTVLALFLGLVLGKKDRFQLILLSISTVIVLACLPLLVTVISLRFSSTVVDSSDQDRVQQMPALHEFWESAPIMGHGLGSYTRRVIRSDDAPYSYEVQLLALAGQVGIVGILLFASLGIFYFRGLWLHIGGRVLLRLGLATMLLAWIAAGLVNPEVISSAASVSYAAIFAMVCLLKERPDPVASFAGDAVLEPLRG